MSRRLPKASFSKPGQCPGCLVMFAADTEVILTSTGTVTCETHRDIFTAEAIVSSGPWSVIRRQK